MLVVLALLHSPRKYHVAVMLEHRNLQVRLFEKGPCYGDPMLSCRAMDHAPNNRVSREGYPTGVLRDAKDLEISKCPGNFLDVRTRPHSILPPSQRRRYAVSSHGPYDPREHWEGLDR